MTDLVLQPCRMLNAYIADVWTRNTTFIGMTSGITSGTLAFLEQTKGIFGTLGIVCTSLIAFAALLEKLATYFRRFMEWRHSRKHQHHAQDEIDEADL